MGVRRRRFRDDVNHEIVEELLAARHFRSWQTTRILGRRLQIGDGYESESYASRGRQTHPSPTCQTDSERSPRFRQLAVLLV